MTCKTTPGIALTYSQAIAALPHNETVTAAAKQRAQSLAQQHDLRDDGNDNGHIFRSATFTPDGEGGMTLWITLANDDFRYRIAPDGAAQTLAADQPPMELVEMDCGIENDNFEVGF